MPVKQRIAALLASLTEGVYEKEEELSLALLSSLAGESVFLLGPPGVAKSLLARRLKFAYRGAKSFEYLMSRFSTPDEIFGPVSISRLKNNDKYERLTENYLPAAEVVFLDEIWKAGPSIQNALLTVLNERVYRNGEEEIHLPMKALVSASNELPEKEHGLAALWDRFLVRLHVHGIHSREKFDAMICSSRSAYEDTAWEADKISDDEYRTWRGEIDNVAVPAHVLGVIDAVRKYAHDYNQKEENAQNKMYISDRRWRKIVRLLKTSAFFNDRMEVNLADCFLIRHCIWNETSQIDTAFQFTRDAIGRHGYSGLLGIQKIKDELAAFRQEVMDETLIEKSMESGGEKNGAYRYYEITNYPGVPNRLLKHSILAEDFRRLDDTARGVPLYYIHNTTGMVAHKESSRMKRGTKPDRVVINGAEYEVNVPEEAALSKKPLPKIEELWDSRAGAFAQRMQETREKLDALCIHEETENEGHLFIPPELKDNIKSYLDTLKKETEKLQIEIRGIRNSYKKIND